VLLVRCAICSAVQPLEANSFNSAALARSIFSGLMRFRCNNPRFERPRNSSPSIRTDNLQGGEGIHDRIWAIWAAVLELVTTTKRLTSPFLKAVKNLSYSLMDTHPFESPSGPSI